jgi:hypothetical protein
MGLVSAGSDIGALVGTEKIPVGGAASGVTTPERIKTFVGAWDLASGGTLTGANTITGTGLTLKAVWNALGVTQTNGYGWWLANTTAAASGIGNQQYSPSITWEGQGWKSNATAASQSVKFTSYVAPTESTAAPNPVWKLDYSVNGAAYANFLVVGTGTLATGMGSTDSGLLVAHAGAPNGLIGLYNNAGTGIYAGIGFNLGSGAVKVGGLVNSYFLTLFSDNVEAARFTTGTRNFAIGSTTDNARLYVSQSALSASWKPTFRLDPGAHTSITNTLENINNDFSAVTQTWAGGGTVATQRGTYFRSQTLAGASAQTFTDAYTLYVDPPVKGTNATITNNWALGVNGHARFGSLGGSVALYDLANGNITISFPAATKGFGVTTGGNGIFVQPVINTAGGFVVTDAVSGVADATARLDVRQGALSSGWIPTSKFTPGAHTSMTAATAFPNQVFSAATLSWVATAGTIAAQKDTEFRAITHSAATSGTFTDLYNVFMEEPAVGGAATATRQFALGLGGPLQIAIGTALGSALANTIGISAKDSSDGAANATLALYLEQAPEATATFTQSHRLKIWVNGTEYYLPLDNV